MVLHAILVALYLLFLVMLGWAEHRRAERRRARLIEATRPAPLWTGLPHRE